MEKGEADFRRELLEGVGGRVIEVGAGHGLNFALYPSTVTEVVADGPEASWPIGSSIAVTTQLPAFGIRPAE